VKSLLDAVTSELVERLADLDDGWVIVDFVDFEMAPDVTVPALRITMSVPSPLLGQRLVHTDMLNPMEMIGDELITRVCGTARLSFGQQRARALGTVQ
jgi:hypothetical protein